MRFEPLGKNQRMVVELGKKKGYVDIIDVRKFYDKNMAEITMNILVEEGFFKKPKLTPNGFKWEYIKE